MTTGLELDWLNILDFKEDEDADFTSAFRRAIAAIDARNGGVLYIPSGTYEVRPIPALPLCSDLTIIGDGANSIIKIADGTGPYKVIFGQEHSTDPRVNSLYFERFSIDQNPIGNPVPSSNGASQFAFSLKNFSKVHFRKLEFNPTTGANAICCNASRGTYLDTTCQDVTVEQCHFYRESPQQVYVDNSAVYLNCPGSIVTNNKFYAFGNETIKARGCIETHGGKSVISGNYSEGYATGINAASRAWGKATEDGEQVSLTPSNITITGNTFTKVKKGIQLWVNHPEDNVVPALTDAQWEANTELIELDSVVISNNTISVDVSDYISNPAGYFGISLAGDYKGNRWLRNITIGSNNIVFTGKSGPTIDVEAGLVPSNFISSYGIAFLLPISLSNISIHNNIISNTPLSAIYLGRLSNGGTSKVSDVQSIKINDNILTNCAYLKQTSSTTSFIDLRGNILGAVIEGNLMNDKFDTEKASYSIRLTPSQGKDIYIQNNILTTKQQVTNIKMLIAKGYESSVKA
ncbi:hypothetical protein HB943_07030 [Listeria weihenstephanensis]|uniref:Pectate lyase superfamily protein domain-containing protein n=1 Tax=Listeria weihenstephanensis TaxID=1006155 RepID=A0A841Z6U6_9LIST|nr:right-handed parallel beta-helix repeat-containing protein [Listeria weihenstephanensis]MBC1500352.1 hypothetical protein [Listeria weihenstephanensis]